MKFRFRLYVLLISSLAYGLALLLPAYHLSDQTTPGWACLAFGWGVGLPGAVAWSANLLLPLILLATAFGRPLACLILGLPAQALSLAAFLMTEIIVDEGGGTRPVVGFGMGMFLWLGSLTLPWAWGVGTFIGERMRKS